MLDSPQRFCIDRNLKKPTCYKVTQNDNTSYNYGKGLCCVTVAETQLNLDKDKLITLEDGKQIWVCDYVEIDDTEDTTPPTDPSNPNETTVLNANIKGDETLKLGVNRIYTAIFTDKNNEIVNDITFTWNIVSDFEISYTTNENKINLFIDDEEFLDSSFLLEILVNNEVVAKKEITVVDLV